MIGYLLRRFIGILSGYAPVSFTICTTTEPEDTCFDYIASAYGVGIFHGDTTNIVNRHLDCARWLGIDHIINIDCDDVFCSPELVFNVLEKMYSYDVVSTEGHPLGTNLFGFSVEALEHVLSSDSARVIDTGWGELFKNNNALSHSSIPAAEHERCDIRLTLDYPEDLLVFIRVIEALDMDKRLVRQDEIIRYIRANPEISLINRHLEETYLKNYEKKKGENG